MTLKTLFFRDLSTSILLQTFLAKLFNDFTYESTANDIPKGGGERRMSHNI